MDSSSSPTASPQISTPTATPTAGPTAAPTATPTATPTAGPTTAVGCAADSFTLKGYDDSSYHDSPFDGCYHALGEGYDGGLTNAYFLDGVSDVDAYLTDVAAVLTNEDVDGYLTESTDDDLGPVFYIDSSSSYIHQSHWVIARMELRESFADPNAYYIDERNEYYQVEDGTDPLTIPPWEVAWGNQFGRPESVSFSVTQGCSYCPPPWPSPRPPATPSPTPSPTPSRSSLGGGGTGVWWLGLVIPLGLVIVVWRLAFTKYPTPPEARGGVNQCTTQGNDTAIAPRAPAPATCATTVADGAAAGTAAVVPGSRVPAAADGFVVGASATVIATAVPASSFAAGGGYTALSALHNGFGNAGQPLPTAVAVPYGTGSELAPVV